MRLVYAYQRWVKSIRQREDVSEERASALRSIAKDGFGAQVLDEEEVVSHMRPFCRGVRQILVAGHPAARGGEHLDSATAVCLIQNPRLSLKRGR